MKLTFIYSSFLAYSAKSRILFDKKGAVVNALGCDIVVIEFGVELVLFQTNTINGSNSTAIVLLQGWIWHYITHEG